MFLSGLRDDSEKCCSRILVGLWIVAAIGILVLTGCGGGGGSSTNKNQISQSASVSVTLSGTGSGTVTSSDGKINCGTICSASYADGATVTLTAAPSSGSTFTGWSGGICNGTVPTCTVTLNSGVAVTANFSLPTPKYTLSITLSGPGSGTVTSADGSINCPGPAQTCSASYTSGTLVTLTALAAPGSAFAGWSGGGCSGTASQCVVNVTAATSVTATFTSLTPPPPTVSNMTWQVTSTCGYTVYWRLFDKDANLVWPDATDVWVNNIIGQTYSETIACTTGHTIAFGASENSSLDTYYWGVGVTGTEACPNCAYTCANVTITVPTLTCP